MATLTVLNVDEDGVSSVAAAAAGEDHRPPPVRELVERLHQGVYRRGVVGVIGHHGRIPGLEDIEPGRGLLRIGQERCQP